MMTIVCSEFSYGEVLVIAANTTMSVDLHLEVSVLSPKFAPTIFHDPVLVSLIRDTPESVRIDNNSE